MNSFANERLMLSLLGRQGESLDPVAEVHSTAFVEICRAHRVAGLVHRQAAKDPIRSAAILPGLHEAARRTLVDNLILLKALEKLSAAMSEEGIGFVLLKGASLLGFLYPEIHLRPMSDLDVLIREKDWPKLAGILESRGYQLPSARDERHYARHWYHQLVKSPGKPPTNLELHWNLESVERSRIDPEELIHEAVPCEIEGESYLRLSDDHLLVHLSVHLAHHYQSPALIWVEDLRRLIGSGKLQWDRIERTARAWGVMNCLAYSLSYVERSFPGTLPPEARAFRLSPARRLILGAFRTANPALPHRPLEGKPLRHVVSMILLDRWGDVARYVAAHSITRTTRAAGRHRGPSEEGPRESNRSNSVVTKQSARD